MDNYNKNLKFLNSNIDVVDLTNSNKLDEDFSNFRLFGIGKPTQKQLDNQARRKAFRKKINEELKGKNKAKALLTLSQRYNPAAAIPRAGVLVGSRVNIFGIAVRLYPAFISPEEAKKKKIRVDAIEPAKKAWEKVSDFWRGLGGNPESLKKALLSGYNKPVFKWTKGAKKRKAINESSFNGMNYYPMTLPSGERLEDDYFNEPHENARYNYNPKELNAAYTRDKGIDDIIVYEDDYYTDGYGVSEATIAAGIGLLGSIVGIISKAGAKKNPYEEGANPQLEAQINAAETQIEPLTAEEEKEIRDAVEDEKNRGLSPDSGDDKILGIPKTAFWIGVGALALIGGFLIYKKYIKK